MIRLLFTKFWFVFLPILFYFLWVFMLSRKARDGQAIAAHIHKGLLFWAIMLSLMMLLGCFLWLGFEQTSNSSGRYVPPRSVNGQIVPAQIVPND